MHATQPAPSVSCRIKGNNIVLATTRALRSLVWVTEVPQTAHGHIKHTHLHTSHTTSEHIRTLKQCHTWIHSHCTYKYDVLSTLTNALHLHTNTHTHTPHSQKYYPLSLYITFFVPKSSSSCFPAQQSSCHRLPSRPPRHMIS